MYQEHSTFTISCTLTFDEEIVELVKGSTISCFEIWPCLDLLSVSCYDTTQNVIIQFQQISCTFIIPNVGKLLYTLLYHFHWLCHCILKIWSTLPPSLLLLQILFFNWDSLHARVDSHFEAWSYKKRCTKRLKH